MPGKQPIEQVPLDRVTQTIFARIHAAMAPVRQEIGKTDRSGELLAEVFANFRESLPNLELCGYNAMREQLGALVGMLRQAGTVVLSAATRAVATQLVEQDLPRLAAIATKLNEEEAPKFFATLRTPDSAFGHFAIDAKKKTTIRRPDFDAAIDRIVSRRMGEMAQLIKQDMAQWLEQQGITDGGVTIEGDGGPRYALRNGGGIWKIVFDWKSAEWKEEKGLRYVAYLLKNPPKEPIHGTKLAARVFGYADIPEISMGKDEAGSRRAIEKEANELMATLNSDDASEVEKDEARERLEELARVRKQAGKRPETNAEKTVRAVRKAIQRLHKNLISEKNAEGKPHPVYGPFAEHIEKYLLNPSARFTGRRGARAKAGVAGCFVYEPPDGVTWAN
ncbi:MAG TPA: hypothetical protein PKM73_16440 [Verrucomicrobiota bacterium]|nr:hypothetical protein [Verrucomicrobiota bacterium]HNU51114.1 hypothetical protein [Verrucomicrobiota bacterium]